MQGLNIARRMPYRWRYVVVVVVPLSLSVVAYILIAEWTVWIGIAASVVGVLFVARSHGQWLGSVTASTLEVRGSDSTRRVSVHPASEEARLANAINRLADAAIAALEAESATRHYHETVLDTIDDGILVVDHAGVLTYSNSAAQSIFEFESATDQDGQPQPLSSKANVIEVTDAAMECVQTGSTVRRSCTLFNPTRQLDVWASPLDGDDDSHRRALLVVRDRTAEHRLTTTLNEFIANASHELRTPITVMLASVEVLQLRDQMTGVDAEFLERIRASARRMAVLVDELLDLTMFDTGQTALHMVPVDVAVIALETCEELRPIAEQQGISLDTVGLQPNLTVNADVDKLQRALTNLMTNAIKFSEAGSMVEVGCEARGESVAVWVKDEGRGIEADHLPHVFDRFFRTQPDVNDDPGFGLGLAIVKNVVELMGGTVEVESTLGVGATFTMLLPALHQESSLN